jgi:hypothetical protein
LLGMERVRSADAVRRAFLKGEAEDYAGWLHKHLDSTYEELLGNARSSVESDDSRVTHFTTPSCV